MPRKAKKKTVVKKKAAAKNTKKVVIRTTHHQPIPTMMSDEFELEFAGIILAGQVPSVNGLMLEVGLNTLIPFSTYGPLYVGTSTNSFLTGTVFTPMGGTTYFNSGTHPTGLVSFLSASSSANGLYSKYTVTGIKYTITASPIAGGDIGMLVVCPDTPSAYNVLPTTSVLAEMRQYPWAKSKMVSGNNNQGNNTLTGYIDVAKYMGVTRSVLMSDIIYSGQSLFGVTANPPSYSNGAAAHLVIGFQCLDSASNASPISLQVRLKYYVTFREPCSKALSD